jgi:uncharacterized protein YecE (DUF72 family)
MATIHIGTSGWYYDEWEGIVYPEKLPKQDRLTHYARLFDTVEVNNTFYGVPRTETLQNWYESTPSDMVFAVKAWREITHEKRLLDTQEDVASFVEHLAPLHDKLGPILFQLPPDLEYNLDLLRTFLNELPSGYNYTCELRHSSWHKVEVLELLATSNVAFCIYDYKGFQTPYETTADFVYMRLHGPTAIPYVGSYSGDFLTQLAHNIREWQSLSRDVYCYFDNTRDASAVPNAHQLLDILASKV